MFLEGLESVQAPGIFNQFNWRRQGVNMTEGLWSDVTGFFGWYGELLGGGSIGEANVNMYVQENLTNPDWIEATHGWMYDQTNDMFAMDADRDGSWDYVGEWNGEIFTYWDGYSWENVPAPEEEEDEFMKEAGGSIPN